jgi:tetratricopeptide (TPR) repeat protein
VRVAPLHVRLADELSRESNIERQAELLARLAAHLARIGRFDDATKKLVELRAGYAKIHTGPATVWIMLAEGLVHLFQEEQLKALDRIKRAQVLGRAMGYHAIIASASAWKAHIELGRSEFAALTESLGLAFENVDANDHDTHTRLAMVLFNALATKGDQVEAQKWFLRAHDRAVKNGDQASIEALLYNRATFGVANLRAACCFHAITPEDISFARSEMESVRNLQQLVRGTTLRNQLDLWFARLMILEGKFDEAVQCLQEVRTTHPFADTNFDQRFIDLEIAYCLAKSGAMGAEEATGKEFADAFDSLDVDEQLVAAWMQFQIASGQQLSTEVAAKAARLTNAKAAFEQMRTDLGAAIAGTSSPENLRFDLGAR